MKYALLSLYFLPVFTYFLKNFWRKVFCITWPTPLFLTRMVLFSQTKHRPKGKMTRVDQFLFCSCYVAFWLYCLWKSFRYSLIMNWWHSKGSHKALYPQAVPLRRVPLFPCGVPHGQWTEPLLCLVGTTLCDLIWRNREQVASRCFSF